MERVRTGLEGVSMDELMAENEEEKSTPSSTTETVIPYIIAAPLVIYFYYRGDTGRALVSGVAGAVLIFVIQYRWNLRKFWWFWVTVAIIAAINIALIILVPWPSGHGIRGPILAPFGAAFGGLDGLVIWIAIKIVGPPNVKEIS